METNLIAGSVLNETKEVSLMLIRCVYDVRIWAENLPSRSCKAYLVILLAAIAEISRGTRRGSDVYL
jgi:hypothetical protein